MKVAHRRPGGATAPGFAARRPAPSPQELRRHWVAAVELSDGLARDAQAVGEGCEPRFPPGAIATLNGHLRDLKADNFPVAFASARAQAAAWLILANMFANLGIGPESRTQMAPFLAAGAHALDVLLTHLRTQESGAWRGMTGEREG